MPAPPPPIAAAPPKAGGPPAAPSRGAPDPPGKTFDKVLDQHDKAWTAEAGGQQNGPATDAPADGKQDQQPADAAAALVALVAGPVPMAPPAPPVTADASVAQAATPVATADVTVAVAPVAVPAQAPVTPAADASVTPATTGAVQPDPVPAAAAPAGDQGTGTPQAPVADATAQNASTGTGTTGGQGNGDAPKGDAHARHAVDSARAGLAGLAPKASDAAAAPTVTAPTPTTAAQTSAPAAPAPAKSAEPVAATAAPETSAPTAPVTAPAAHTAPRTVTAPNPVPVAHAPAALADLVHVAQSRGATQARMVLHPESLGGVEVHLRQTAEGIRATVHVHHPEALQALQAGLGDLRRGLEDRGVTIDQLDLGLAPGNQDQQQQGNGAARGDGGLRSRTGSTGLSGSDDGAEDDEILTTPNATSTGPAHPAAGVLVDVMA